MISSQLGQAQLGFAQPGNYIAEGESYLPEITPDDYLICNDSPDLQSDVDFTISIWFKPHADAVDADDCWRFFGDAGLDIRIGFMAGQSNACIYAATPDLKCQSDNIITPDEWHLAVIYFDGSEVVILIDNVEVANAAGANTGFSTVGTYLKAGMLTETDLEISIDEMGIWIDSNALTTEQMTMLYNAGNGIRPSFS